MSLARRILALDYGTRAIGYAVGEEASQAVEPIGALRARQGVPIWADVDAAFKRWQPELLVVGLPLNMDGTESDMSGKARAFAAQLSERYDVPHRLSDERLSTRTAAASWDGKDKNRLQGLSAAVILSDYLQRQEVQHISSGPGAD